MSVQECNNLPEAGEYEKKMQEEVPYLPGTKKAGNQEAGKTKSQTCTKKRDGTIYIAFKDNDTISTLYD
jgi:hypothetical protein